MLNPTLDLPALAEAFRIDDRVRIPDALQPARAQEIHALIANETAYATMTAVDGSPRAIFPDELARLGQAERADLQRKVAADASRGAGFLYEGHQMAESANARLRAVLEDLNAAPVLEAVRTIVGAPEIAWADGQATRYVPGNFLTRHLDDPAGESRIAAYVLSLTPNWHPDWGGLLQFYEPDGTPRDAWAPGFNVLSLSSLAFEVDRARAAEDEPPNLSSAL
ncbi:MAG: 2OG-Fe(II) oxygenase family protein, partial [Pseudomonadota bacterium]